MNWKPGTEKPDTVGPITALIAVRDPDDGELFLIGIFEWKNEEWMDEGHGTGVPKRFEEFWWMLESELLSAIQPADENARYRA